MKLRSFATVAIVLLPSLAFAAGGGGAVEASGKSYLNSSNASHAARRCCLHEAEHASRDGRDAARNDAPEAGEGLKVQIVL
jgi:hypothetical protein